MDHLIGLKNDDGIDIAVVNLSFGSGPHARVDECDFRADGSPRPLREAVDRLLQAGISTVVSSGNHGRDFELSSPGCVSTAVTVGSTDHAGNVSEYSNVATWMDLFASGESVHAASPGSGIEPRSGTSMAAAHVAGALAVLAGADRTATPHELLASLRLTGISTGETGASPPSLDLDAALTRLTAPRSLPLEVIIDDAQGQGMVTRGAFDEAVEATRAQSGQLAYGGRAVRSTGLGVNEFEVRVRLPRPGVYRAYGWWPELGDSSTSATFDFAGLTGIRSEPAMDDVRSVVVDQSVNGGRWVELGDFELVGDGRETVRLSDRSGFGPVVADALRFVLLSDLPVKVVAEDPPLAVVGFPYRSSIATDGGTAPLKLDQMEGALPPGISFDPGSGLLSGTPVSSGSTPLVFQVVDRDGQLDVAEVTLEVVDNIPPMARPSAENRTGAPGDATPRERE